jgi:hypothetical protein
MVGSLLPSNRTLIDALPGLGNATTTPVRILILGLRDTPNSVKTDSIAHLKLDRHRSSPLALALQAGGRCIQPQPKAEDKRLSRLTSGAFSLCKCAGTSATVRHCFSMRRGAASLAGVKFTRLGIFSQGRTR